MPPLPSRRSTDFIVVGLRVAIPTGSDLRVVARRYGFRGLLAFLQKNHQIRTARAVVKRDTGEAPGAREAGERDGAPADTQIVTSYWYLDCSPLRSRIFPSSCASCAGSRKLPTLTGSPTVRAPWPPTGHGEPDAAVEGVPSDPAPVGIAAAAAWAVTDGSGVGLQTSRRHGAPGTAAPIRRLLRLRDDWDAAERGGCGDRSHGDRGKQ